MQSNRRRTVLIGLLALAIVPIVAAAETRDMAQYMPGETVLYVGWATDYKPDSPEVRWGGQYLETVLKLAASEGEFPEEVAPLMNRLPDALVTLQTSPVGLALIDVALVEGQPDIQAALIVAGGDKSQELADLLRDFITMAGGPDQITTADIGGVQMSVAAPPDAPFKLVWGVHKGCFVLGLGEQATGNVIARINGEGTKLADAEEFKFDRQKVNAKLPATFFCLYVDVHQILTRAKALATELGAELPPMVDPLLNELGIDAVQSKYLHYETSDIGPRMAAFAHVNGELKGLLSLWKQAPLTDDDLKIVPQNAYWAEVGNFDLGALWREILRVVGAVSPDAVPMIEGPVAMSTSMLGFSITDEFLPALGDTWAFFDAPSHGGILMSGTVLVAEVRQPDKLNAMLDRVVQMVAAMTAQSNEGKLLLKQTQHGGHTINYAIVGGLPVPIMPAWGIVGDRWVLGLTPQTVAAAMKQLDPKTRGPSLLDDPFYQAARSKLPKETIAVGYINAKYIARMFYPLVSLAGNAGVAMFAEHGMELDLNLMPPVDDAVAKVTNYVGVSHVGSDGILYDSIGDGGQIALGGVAGAAMATSIMLPSLARARAVAKEAVSSANLKQIGIGCIIYANDHEDRFPDSLQQLIEGGMITEQVLRSPRDPTNDSPYAYVAGQTANDNPRNVLAYEYISGDEEANVLFLDGHVEVLAPGGLKVALRKTYERLGRTDEMPAEFAD